MRAHTITTMIVVGVCALAIPASVSARTTPPPANPSPDVNSGYAAHTTGIGSSASEPTSQGGSGGSPDVNSGYAAQTTGIGSSLSGEAAAVAAGHAHRTPGELAQRTGPGGSALVSSSPASTSDGFDWTSAAVGAGAAMALACLGGAVLLTVRRRTTVSPSDASMS